LACGGPDVTRQCETTLVGLEDSTWNDWSGELSLAWHFYEDNSIYVKWGRGWKAG